VWGTLLARKTYKFKDYVVAGGVTFGTTVFLLTGEVTAKHAKTSSRATSETSFLGLFIMTAYLFFDGCEHTYKSTHSMHTHTHTYTHTHTHTHTHTPHTHIHTTHTTHTQVCVHLPTRLYF
jgi:ABC-type nickel/cobalt efflux system permease component RcnA